MSRTALAICLALTIPSLAAAGPGERFEGRKDRAELRDDLRDERRAQALLDEFDRAAAARNRRALRVIEARVSQALAEEANEANRETAEAAREAREAGREVEHERRELARDVHRGDRHGFREDRRDLQDDRRDAADDRRDFMQEADYRRRILELRDEWARLEGLHGRGWVQRKHDMLVELVRLSRYELRSDVKELREDREERREDRRERWEEHQDGEHEPRGW